MGQLLDHPKMPTKKACKALRVKDNLTPLEAVMWLARSLPAPMLEGRSRPSRGAGTVATSRAAVETSRRRWRATLLQSGHGRSGFEDLRARAWAAAEASVRARGGQEWPLISFR